MQLTTNSAFGTRLPGRVELWPLEIRGRNFVGRDISQDQPHRFQRGHRIAGKQDIGQPLQIGKRLRRIDQPRQVLALGLTGLAPAMRAFRKA